MRDANLIEPWALTDKELDEALAIGLEACLTRTRETFEARIPADIHFLSRWACFQAPGEEKDDFDDFLRERLLRLAQNGPAQRSLASYLDKVATEESQKEKEIRRVAETWPTPSNASQARKPRQFGCLASRLST